MRLIVVTMLFVALAHDSAQSQNSTGTYSPTIQSAAAAQPSDARPLEAPTALLEEERVNMAVYDSCNQGVVHITTRSASVDVFLQVSVQDGSGSGSVLDKAGHIVTNHHVISGARKITVRLYNNASYPAVVIGNDPVTDIAILKVNAPPEHLHPIRWGESQGLRVGQRIYAIGNPFGLERTMSTGMISAVNRQIPSREDRSMHSRIQIDAALNQGNSGGPLINTSGQLIGMNTAIMSSDGDSAGVGLAIPVSTLQRIVPQLLQHGRVIRPWIGITRVYERPEGLLIISTTGGGPADQAGLRGFSIVMKSNGQSVHPVIDPSTADLILAVDSVPVRTSDELLAAIEKRKPGDRIIFTIQRAGQNLNVPVTLGQAQ